MEAVEDLQVNAVADSVKSNVVIENPPDSDVSPKSNGLSHPVVPDNSGSDIPEKDFLEGDNVPETDNTSTDSGVMDSSTATENIITLASDNFVSEATSAVASLLDHDTSAEGMTEVITTSVIIGVVDGAEEIHTEEVVVEHVVHEPEGVDYTNDTVAFETKVLVEKSDNDTNNHPESTVKDHENATNILSELGQNIELSDVLRSSDTTEGIDNNNSGREVFNKEELLDILEGNDIATPVDTKKHLEAQIAINQLTKLKSNRKINYKSSVECKGIKKNRRRKQSLQNRVDSDKTQDSSLDVQNTTAEDSTDSVKENSSKKDKQHTDSIVHVLVKDWDDDEPEADHESIKEEGEKLSGSIENLEQQQAVTNVSNHVDQNTSDLQSSENQNLTKNGDENPSNSQRRIGRVIKKKVIFDPDNPDTFTKGKNITKIKDSTEKEVSTPAKKIKTEEKQRSASKSPTSKMAWKKPQPKNSNKQNRRLTEIDKLLMDEGAVNMIYQLTPDASKQASKKNMRTKAEFIKKLQSSTPEGKEMKFRERKKETVKSEEEAKKILGVKHRSSLSSSAKSPLVSEDFENQSADDSIIYRRHSSSSYSSSCMSPRRLSDVDVAAAQQAARASRNRSPSDTQQQISETNDDDQDSNFFIAYPPEASNTEIINKTDCLSIKEKLNSKLSLALNKRKSDPSNNDKPPKQKKTKADVKDNVKIEKISNPKLVSLRVEDNVAEINIGKVPSVTVELLRDLHLVLNQVDNMKNISVTLLTSDCGTLCSELDLRRLLDDNMKRRTNYAFELAEVVRTVLCAAEQHSKLLVSAVWGACSGLSLPLLVLCDIVLTSQDASFQASLTPLPGVAVLSTQCQRLSHAVVNELVMFGRRVGAAEAVSSGLATRALWAPRIRDQARDIVRQIAAQPAQSVLLKKKLLNLNKSSESQTKFQSILEKERDLVVQYWTSVEGQDLLRATYEA